MGGLGWVYFMLILFYQPLCSPVIYLTACDAFPVSPWQEKPNDVSVFLFFFFIFWSHFIAELSVNGVHSLDH